MLSEYPPEINELLRKDPLADLDSVHDAIVELIDKQFVSDQEGYRHIMARSSCREIDRMRRQTRESRYRSIVCKNNYIKYDPSSSVEANENKVLIASSLGSLSSTDQAIIRMRYQENYSVAQIAQMRGVSHTYIYARLNQAMLKLKYQLIRKGLA